MLRKIINKMDKIEVHFPLKEKVPGKIKKLRVTVGTMVFAGQIILLYQNIDQNDENNEKLEEKKLRTLQFGRVTDILVNEGDIVKPGQLIVLMAGCKHPTVMKDLCAECGADLREEALNKDGNNGVVSKASVPMVHSIPELKVTQELAEKIGKEDEERLLRDRKLALLVDLDQTIVHSTNDNIPAVMKDVFHYQLYGPNSPWYHTRLRPGTRHFLAEMSKIYELHICTFGARNYAHTVAALLDKEGTLFSHRILSRDECFNPASKTANLKALFPCGDDLVCIIDDREDVWQGCGNLVQVKPYHFFRHTGDIHAPPGLDKREIGDLPTNSNVLLESNLLEQAEKDDVKNKVQINKTSSEEVTINNQSMEKTEADHSVDKETVETNEENIKDENNDEISKEKDDKKTLEEENDNESDSNILNSKKCEINDEKVTINDDNNKLYKQEEKSKVKTENLIEENNQIASSKSSSCSEVKKDEKSNDDDKVKTVETMKSSTTDKKVDDIEDDDHDDYLLYLEDILRRIRTEFYDNFDKGIRKPLREIIPQVRARVLKGLVITFSGLIPTHQKLTDSRAYKVAKAFGAEVTQDLTENTTHLVAIKPGTAKVNAAKKNLKIKIVNPDWLWSCAERWEHVDERLFPLTLKARGSRIPPPHCSSPDRVEVKENEIADSFASSINPLMSFTQEEIDNMDKEVDEDLNDIEMETMDNEEDFDLNDDNFLEPPEKRQKWDDKDSDEEFLKEDMNNEDAAKHDDDEEKEKAADDDDDDDPYDRFRRGEDLPDDLDLGEYASQDSVEIDDPVSEDDDREWNAMGAALEREFLSD